MTESVLTFSNIATGYGSKKNIGGHLLGRDKGGNPHTGWAQRLR